MNEQPRHPARYYEDAFVYTPSGRRVAELTDDELLIYDPSRAPEPEPPPPGLPPSAPEPEPPPPPSPPDS